MTILLRPCSVLLGGKRKADGEGEGAPPNSVLVVDPEASVETVNSSDPDSGVGHSKRC